jgi:cyclophilin family peptidyl-prolyl cis-trans isomerase
MRFMSPKLIVTLIAFAFSCVGDARTRADLVPEDTLLIDLVTGRVVIEMFPAVAPGHVARIRELARSGLYDGVAFHRVIDGFMAQTGDVKYGNVKSNYNPSLVGTGNSDLADLAAEFNELKHFRGTASMARSQDPNSANSQFFICFADATFLDGQYTVWGQVVEGMEHVDKIERGVAGSGAVGNPDSMVKVTVASDTILRIDDNASAGGDGTSWPKAFSSLSDALDAAGTGFELWVAAGEYRLTGSLESRLKNEVKSFGGFKGTELIRTPLGEANATRLVDALPIQPVDSSASPHTYGWYFQPEWGWIWTSEKTFPYVYLAGGNGQGAGWLMFREGSAAPVYFYSFAETKWVTLGE